MAQRLQVAVGGAVGTALRLLLATPLLAASEGVVPVATLAVNVVGAALLGVLAGVAEVVPRWRRTLPLLGTGVLGSLTTFSALAVAIWLLVEAGRPALAAGYAVASVTLGMVVAAGGLRVGRRVGARPADAGLEPR